MLDSSLQIIIILWSIIAFLIWIIIYFLLRNTNRWSDDKSLKLLQQHLFDLSHQLERKLNETNRTLDNKLSESNKYLSENIQRTFATSSKIGEEANKRIEEITKKLSELWETNKQIKDIGGQLEWLERILTNPKQRGILWEYFLETILKNMFPPENYEMQYRFNNGEIVDAVIKIQGRLIPVDSKLVLKTIQKSLRPEVMLKEKSLKKNLKKIWRNVSMKRVNIFVQMKERWNLHLCLFLRKGFIMISWSIKSELWKSIRLIW